MKLWSFKKQLFNSVFQIKNKAIQTHYDYKYSFITIFIVITKK